MTERRWRVLEDSPALVHPGWLPPAAEVPELADLRAEHERLLRVFGAELAAAGQLQRERETELEARRAVQERAFLGGEPEPMPELTVTEEAVAAAQARAEVARDALQAFVQQAVAQIAERTEDLLTGLDEVVRAAQLKRAEAEQILAEAHRMEAGTKRLRNWLARANGLSPMGHYPYEEMRIPQPPEPLDLEAVLEGGSHAEVMISG